MKEEIKTGDKFTDRGWVKTERIKTVPDTEYEQIVGLLVNVDSASSITRINEFLERVNGYKIKIDIEVINTPDNAPMFDAPNGYCSSCGKKIR